MTVEEKDQPVIYIVSANENLLERLRLIAQNSNILSPSTATASAANNSSHLVKATAILAKKGILPTTHHCIPITGSIKRQLRWIVLVSKEWEPAILDSLGDICRLAMSQGDSIGAEILVIKKDAFPTDFDLLNSHLDSIRMGWTAEWTSHYEKYKKLGDSNARTEHLQKAERWLKPDCPFKCSLAYVDDQDLPQKISDFFQIDSGINICDVLTDDEEDRPAFFNKPPALHWTHYPREAEMQVSFKFNFPQGTVPEQLFRKWTAISKTSFQSWEYEYEWTNGVLLRQELVKITVVRSSAHIIEVSGRIDKDEAAEEEEETNNTLMPLSKVWPYLLKVVHAFLTVVDQMKTLPYTLGNVESDSQAVAEIQSPFGLEMVAVPARAQTDNPVGEAIQRCILSAKSKTAAEFWKNELNLIFIGQAFFKCPQGARIVTSRSLDAIQTLSAIQRTQSVRFKADQYIYSLNLEQSFPGIFKPKSLSDFSPNKFVLDEPKAKSPDNNSVINPSSNSFDKETLPTTHQENHCDEGVEPRLSPHNLHVERQLSGHKNRGRRVSFGAIRAIPTMDGTQSTTCTSPLLMGITNHRDLSPDPYKSNMEEENDTKTDNDEVQSSTVVEYVDEMLQKAIDEVTVMD